jgi:hypothetical protein
MAELPLMEKPQSIIGIGIGGREAGGPEKIFFRKVYLVERDSPPDAKDGITRCQRNDNSENGKENPFHEK